MTEVIPGIVKERKKQKRKNNKKSPLWCSSTGPLKTSFSFDWNSVIPDQSNIDKEHTTHKEKSTKHHILVLQTVENHYALRIEYRIYSLSNQSLCYDETISSYFARLVKEVESRMKTHVFNPKAWALSLDFLRPPNSHMTQTTSTKKRSRGQHLTSYMRRLPTCLAAACKQWTALHRLQPQYIVRSRDFKTCYDHTRKWSSIPLKRFPRTKQMLSLTLWGKETCTAWEWPRIGMLTLLLLGVQSSRYIWQNCALWCLKPKNKLIGTTQFSWLMSNAPPSQPSRRRISDGFAPGNT